MVNQAHSYDYIIAGMGCAGLSLAMQLIQRNVPFKKVLLIDKDLKSSNDRTWCFWSKEKEPWYAPAIQKKWEKFNFSSPEFKAELHLQPYTYNMLRGIDFYTFCLDQIKRDPRFEIKTEEVKQIGSESGHAFLRSVTQTYTSTYLFNSIFKTQSIKKKHINYTQHFRGWLVETTEDVFNPELPMFMDFNTDQHQDCRFFYVIPYSKNKALIEYTGFSEKNLSTDFYDVKIKAYLEDHFNTSSYTILESEEGEIPMAESRFINPYGPNVLNIGVSGGSSKPSTGYTFYFIQKNTENIISQLVNGVALINAPERKKRFLLYDKILLDVLHNKEVPASKVFSTLFKKNKIQDLLAFLNEESTLKQEIKIMNSVQKGLFVRSAIRKLLG